MIKKLKNKKSRVNLYFKIYILNEINHFEFELSPMSLTLNY